MLAIPGSSVTGVSSESAAGVARLRLRARHPTRPCGQRCRSVYDRSTRRWRHLDLGGMRLYFEAEIRRVDCPNCRRVRTEVAPWTRSGARHSRDLQDLIADIAQRMDEATVARLLQVSWEAMAGTGDRRRRRQPRRDPVRGVVLDRRRRGVVGRGSSLPHRGRRARPPPGRRVVWERRVEMQ